MAERRGYCRTPHPFAPGPGHPRLIVALCTGRLITEGYFRLEVAAESSFHLFSKAPTVRSLGEVQHHIPGRHLVWPDQTTHKLHLE